MFENFAYGTMTLLTSAQEKALMFKQPYISTEHVLLALTQDWDSVGAVILRSVGVELDDVGFALESSMTRGPALVQGDLPLAPRLERVLVLAKDFAERIDAEQVGTEHILWGLASDEGGLAAQVLRRYGINGDQIYAAIVKRIQDARLDFVRGDIQDPVDLSNFAPPTDQTVDATKMEGFSEKEFYVDDSPAKVNFSSTEDSVEGGSILEQYGVNLTRKAAEGVLDPVIGRDEETYRVLRTLARRGKNNPILVGPPGVGKTAIVEGLAQAIVEGKVPNQLANKEVYSLDLASLLSGSRYRGDFEERLTGLLAEVQQRNNVVLFVDEIHTLVGAGSDGGALDAANIMKPMLARGELQTVGATTLEEFRKYFEKDPALERRFQPVMVDEPDPQVAIQILRGLKRKYESHHEVKITESAIVAAVNLSHRYIRDRNLPDKAIDLIDEAASRLSLQRSDFPESYRRIETELMDLQRQKQDALESRRFDLLEDLKVHELELRETRRSIEHEYSDARRESFYRVDEDTVAEVLSEWTGIPVAKMSEHETSRLLKMEKELGSRVIGQDHAVTSISKAMRRMRAGLGDSDRPAGSFIFVGPSGVGKTELAKALSEFLFGGEEELIVLDMSEFMEKHSISNLIGAPAGYVGYEDSGRLTDAVRRKPFSVVLFDEIEKAHPDIFNLFLQILGEGRLTDSHGNVIDFRNTVIVMTSNLGADHLERMRVESQGQELSYTLMKEAVGRSLEKHFRPEFLNRIDDIIVFNHLQGSDVVRVVDIMVDKLIEKVKLQNMDMIVSDSAKRLVAEKGYDPSLGARPLRRTLQNLVEEPLSERLLWREFQAGSTIVVDVRDGEIFFSERSPDVEQSESLNSDWRRIPPRKKLQED